MLDLSPWPDADAILDEALALPAADREAFVRRRAATQELADALLLVLREDEADDDFLRPAGALSGPLFEEWRVAESGAPRLDPGDVIGTYRVVEWLGSGGMGEVYRAHDSSLGRDVALKILPAEVSEDSTRLARFRREARLLASLNHPNIGAIHSVVDDDRHLALVLELVEGPTLADRLQAGALPVPDALSIARQIGEALETAHQKSVVHRDLKPANIKLTPGGIVKVLDFGIAKAIGQEDLGDGGPSLTGASPHAAILGTAAYMSPEQARGAPVDHRTDIWSFGCVLAEMLTGRRAFVGGSTPEVVARVIEREPDLTGLPPSLPESITRLLGRTLEKDPRRRLGWIGDALLEIDDATSPSPTRHSKGSRTGLRRAAVAAAALAAIGLAAFGLWQARAPVQAGEPVRLAVPIPAEHEIVVGQLPAIAVSRDGRVLVYRARHDGVMKLFQRSLDGMTSIPIAGTEDVSGHALSPDGRNVVLYRNGALIRMSLSGGSPVTIGAVGAGAGLSWGVSDTVVVAAGAEGVLHRVPAGGGTPVPFTVVDAASGHLSHANPELLPDGRTVLFTVNTVGGPHVAVTDLDGGPISMLVPGRQPRYLPSGHLLFARERSLWSAPFSPGTRRLAGEPVEGASAIERSTLNSFVHFAVADDGTLFYIPERAQADLMRLVWVDRAGREVMLQHSRRGITRFGLSPDGSRIALAVADGEERDIWVLDRDRESATRLTFDAIADTQPVWSPDGTQIVFRSDRDGGGLFVRAADGSSDARRLTRADGGFHIPYTFAPDGRHVLFTHFRDYTDQDIRSVDIESGAETDVLAEPFAESRPALSPDGRWLLYQSDESGRFEVYMRPYPDVRRARWQVSVDGGTSPVWRRDGREVYFASRASVMAASVGPSGQPGRPIPLFDVPPGEDRLGPTLDVSKDGTRFLVLMPARVDPVADRPQVWIVQHWLTHLRRVSEGGR